MKTLGTLEIRNSLTFMQHTPSNWVLTVALFGRKPYSRSQGERVQLLALKSNLPIGGGRAHNDSPKSMQSESIRSSPNVGACLLGGRCYCRAQPPAEVDLVPLPFRTATRRYDRRLGLVEISHMHAYGNSGGITSHHDIQVPWSTRVVAMTVRLPYLQ